jgi:hypothetical protein
MIARTLRSWRLLLTLMALTAQLAGGASVPPAVFVSADAVGVPICHGGEEPVDTPAPQHSDDCLLCPMCLAVVGPSVLLPAGAAVLPIPSVRAIGLAAPPPQATAPPSAFRLSSQPRAPPSTV